MREGERESERRERRKEGGRQGGKEGGMEGWREGGGIFWKGMGGTRNTQKYPKTQKVQNPRENPKNTKNQNVKNQNIAKTLGKTKKKPKTKILTTMSPKNQKSRT